tara:strand:- start:1399 stop:1539 length:141 start_codon:yes stop_codon:yes gene_type:complete
MRSCSAQCWRRGSRSESSWRKIRGAVEQSAGGLGGKKHSKKKFYAK